ncbi:MAG: competence protein ComEA [Alteromonadaceae bacterium]|jgi:competence protein ComEA
MNKLLSVVLTAVLLSYFSLSPAYANTEPNSLTEPVNESVSINLADEVTLVTLKGIGHKKALAIIAFREKNGNFTHVDELLKVKGIGKHVLKENKHRLKI